MPILKENGKIAFVLPKSLLSGASWFLAQALLAHKYHVEYIVVSYDGENGYNFSESTSLSEALIVARKLNNNAEETFTKFVMMLRKPKTAFEAISLAKAIIRANDGEIISIGESIALVSKVSGRKLIEKIDNWGRFVAFPERFLNKFVLDLEDGNLFGKQIPMCMLGDLVDIGIDAHQFHDLFQKVDKKVPGSYPTIYGGGEEQRTFMKASFNAYIAPQNEKAEKIFKEKASILLVPDRIRITTAHVISLLCDEPTLSNIFYAIRIKEPEYDLLDYYKALCVWMNSTFSILLMLANRQETEGGWIRLKMTHWRLQKVLDIRNVGHEAIKRLANLFDEISRKKMRRLPQQYDPDNPDPVRLQIDKGVLDTLGIQVSDQELLDLYRKIYEAFKQWLFKQQV